MRIESPRALTVGDRRRIEADVIFEDTDRAPFLLYIEADPPLADALEPLPEAFVLQTYATAVWMGERRLHVDGGLDPVLVSGLEQAMGLFHEWYAHCRPLTLEPSEGLRLLTPAPRPYTAALCSGGLDALAMLRENWLTLPPDHGRYMRTAVCLFGYAPYEFENGEPSPERLAHYERKAKRLEALTKDFACTLVRVYTNGTLIFPEPLAYLDAGHSGTFLAPLVAATSWITDAYISSGGASLYCPPHGSHPLLDGLYSSSAARTHMGQPLVTRHEKVRQIKDWEPAYGQLHPCVNEQRLSEGEVNCGTCEKCVRTMVSLLLWGALDRFSAFPANDVTPEMIARSGFPHGTQYLEKPEILDGLRALGREDLIKAIKRRAKRRTETWWGRRVRRSRRSIRKRLGLSPYG